MVAYDANAKALLKSVGARESALWWVKAVGAQTTPKSVTSANGNVTTDTYSGGKGGAEVVLVSIENGPHDWPGGLTRQGAETTTGVDATDLIWAFFLSHPKG
jgi:polyhydroxybutyrate depolymerase